MECYECKRGMLDGVALFRMNEKGVEGIWACEDHASKDIPKDTLDLVHTIEGKDDAV